MPELARGDVVTAAGRSPTGISVSQMGQFTLFTPGGGANA
jgi:hypothetical protein